MKEQVYPTDGRLRGMHSFFVDGRGTWFRRLGSYSIQVLDAGRRRPLYEEHDMTVTGHAGRYLFGTPVV
jgi:hypothetical protein